MIIVLAIIAGLATAILTFRIFFETIGELFECVGEALRPRSFFLGLEQGDYWMKLKLYVYLGLSAAIGFLTHHTLSKIWG